MTATATAQTLCKIFKILITCYRQRAGVLWNNFFAAPLLSQCKNPILIPSAFEYTKTFFSLFAHVKMVFSFSIFFSSGFIPIR